MDKGQRPIEATGAAIIVIVFNGLGGILNMAGIIDCMKNPEALVFWRIFALVLTSVSLAVGVLGLVGGILMLMNKKAGLTLVMVYAIVGLIASVFSFILTLAIGGAPDILGLLLGAVVPVVVLVLVFMKPVKDFYAKAA